MLLCLTINWCADLKEGPDLSKSDIASARAHIWGSVQSSVRNVSSDPSSTSEALSMLLNEDFLGGGCNITWLLKCLDGISTAFMLLFFGSADGFLRIPGKSRVDFQPDRTQEPSTSSTKNFKISLLPHPQLTCFLSFQCFLFITKN